MSAVAPNSAPINLPGWRARTLLLMLLAGFLVLIGRAVYLQGLNNDFLQKKGDARYGRVIELSATRGMITDRNREPLAISTPVESVWASPADVNISQAQVKRLSQLLELDTADIHKRLTDTNREFVYLKRHLPPEQAAKIVELNVPGLFLQREYRRYYPGSEYFAHLIGFTNVDDQGQEALELAFDKQLAGKPGSRRVIKDRLGRIVEDVESVRSPQQGRDLALSIDAKIQYLAYRELKNAVDTHRAKAGGIVVLDVNTGEVLAMANLPSYNPNNRGKLEPRRTRNRTVTDLFEPGSTLKPFTVAAAMESGLYKFDSVVQTGSGQLTIGKATIHDAHPAGALTVAQVIQKSSNVGAAKIALALPAEKLWDMFSQVGFGTQPRSGFPGEVSGKLRAYASWRPIEQATMSYGHGISLSLLQLARAYLVFASDGEIRPVTVVKLDAPADATRVISAETALQVRRMLELVVQPGGTAPRAQITGYRVAGKTGTAHKLDGATYAPNKYVSSFIGFAPASAPRLIVAVMIDEPTDGQYYGGTVAAPAFSNVMSGSLRLLGVKPDAPMNNVVLPPPDAPEVREEV
ncbi:MAG: peptidoglycan glycosyltransferase [Betaproteobacteria bacterium]|nr:peptidoglycan glycosyltransferase [Betaproteobacteria bacterium]